MRRVVVPNTKTINNSSVAQTKHSRKTRLSASKLSKAIKNQLKKSQDVDQYYTILK